MPLVSLLVPVETSLGIGPRDLQHGERRQPVEPDGLPEEGPVPAAIDLSERDSMTVDDIRMALAVRQRFTRGGLLSEGVEHAVHGVDIEPEHGEFRSAVRVREADRVGESRTDLVFGNHHDVPSVLLHMLDDRQIHTVRFVPVAVVMAEDTAARERIITHMRRVRREPSRRATGVWTLSIEQPHHPLRWLPKICARTRNSLPKPIPFLGLVGRTSTSHCEVTDA